jgi:hypothetical protein
LELPEGLTLTSAALIIKRRSFLSFSGVHETTILKIRTYKFGRSCYRNELVEYGQLDQVSRWKL